jgi:hypothetical protein
VSCGGSDGIKNRRILLAKSHQVMRGGIGHRPCERRDTGVSRGGFQEPLSEPEHVQPRGRSDVSRVHPPEADVARPS